MEIDVISEVAVQVIVFQGQDFTDFRFDVGFELIQVNISKDNTRFARHCIGRRRGITPKCHYSEVSKLRKCKCVKIPKIPLPCVYTFATVAFGVLHEIARTW